MVSGFSIGYVQFTIVILVFTGILMLRIDVKAYKMKNMNKEKKLSRVLGWINIIFGIVTFLGNWAYRTFFSG